MGQLGSRVTEILLERGHRVVALDLRNDSTVAVAARLAPDPGLPGELIPAFMNLLDEESLHALVDAYQPKAIVHVAAMVAPPCYRNPAAAYKVNVEGTRNLVAAAQELAEPPTFVLASSSAVYGPRNPHRFPDLLTRDTPLAPADCYGAQKLAAEEVVTTSGLPYAILRLGAIVSPDGLAMFGPDYFVLLRATPRDNRIHAVDARDAALAFANAAEADADLSARILLVGGNQSYMLVQSKIQDDMMTAAGVGPLGG
nr:NAD-dependent epimerase/dehydratase family protein [Micromonospora sp. DSM 115978]